MIRILTGSESLAAESPALGADALRHLKVLRVRPGEEVELFDGAGGARVYRWRQGGGLEPAGERRQVARPSRSSTLFACVTKGSRWDWTIEKATELGVTRIVPVLSERTIVRIAPGERAAKRERWQRIAEDAARQSDALWLPEIASPVDFAEAVRLAAETTCFVGALVTPMPRPLAAAIRERLAAGDDARRSLSVFVGPEGDFTSAELEALLKVAVPTSFGPTILRAETAAIFAVSVLAAISGENS